LKGYGFANDAGCSHNHLLLQTTMSLETSSISVDDYFWSFENDELSHLIAIGSCQLFFLADTRGGIFFIPLEAEYRRRVVRSLGQLFFWPSLMGGIFFIPLEAEYRRPLEDIVQWEE